MKNPTKRILILDFGSQYTQLIARRIRDFGVYCELHPCDMSEQAIKDFAPAGIILSGGPESVYEPGSPRAPKIVFELGVPVLGICYGMQTMAVQLGGEVEKCDHREFGYAQAIVLESTKLLSGIEDRIGANGEAYLDVWMSHGDRVCKIPPRFKVIVSTPNTPIAGMANEEKQLYAILFHPEVTHTHQGDRIIERFVRGICDCPVEWTSNKILAESIEELRTKVGQEQVILGLSGGVDSTVVAALLHKAIDKQLICVFVDHGFLRLGDVEVVMQVLAKHMKIQVVYVNAKERFFTALAGVTDPEQKRKLCGKLFIDVFEEEAAKYPQAQWLAQGTIYSDVIESAATDSGKAHQIKSHHNVGGLPANMRLKLLEPLRELFKDEVRKLGLELGLPADLVYKHPFPGPGLAIRVLGEIKQEYLEILRKADAVFLEELHRANYYHKVKQAFAVFLPVKSVGVIGDARQYAYVIALRAVETTDFMTARWAHLPYELLETVSNRIINEIPGVSRVVYDISSKPPATIEWE